MSLDYVGAPSRNSLYEFRIVGTEFGLLVTLTISYVDGTKEFEGDGETLAEALQDLADKVREDV
jgi:hypothetical protein